MMQWMVLFFTVLNCLPLLLFSQDEVMLTRQAEGYFQAKEYEQAKNLFEKLQTLKLKNWQRGRLQFNIATLSMEQKNYDQAIKEYLAIGHSFASTPYLARALQTNLAILQYLQAMQVVKIEKISLEDFSRAFYLLRSALNHVNKAEHAACYLQQIEGREQCKESEDLIELRSAIKRELAVTTLKYGEMKISETKIREGIPFLLSGVNLALSHINFLEHAPLEGTLRKKYLKFFSADLDSWNSLWESQIEKLKGLEKAKKQFEKGVHHLYQDELSESRMAFLSSEITLNKWMQVLWGNDVFRDVLQKLLNFYQQALDQVPLQPPTLYQLMTEQNRVEAIIEDGKFYLPYLTFSNEQLQISLKFSRKAKRYLSRFYLEESRQWIRRLLRIENPDPEHILEAAIEDQVHAFSLAHLVAEIEDEKDHPFSNLKESQGLTLKTALPFISTVLKKEKIEWPQKCQCRPWNQVIPLFIKGELAALSAQKILKQKNLLDPLVVQKQQMAIKYWKEALEALRFPEQQEKKPPPSFKPPAESQPKTSIKKIMRQLQNMSKDDRKSKPQSKKSQKGIRPW